MNNSAMALLALTTVLLFVVVVFSNLDFSFSWVFVLTTIGQIVWVYTVFRVLKDNYTTDKTFEDFYEDYPIGRKQ